MRQIGAQSLFSKDFIASPSKATIMVEPFLLEAIKLQRTPLICETDLLKYNFRMTQAAEQLHAIQNYMKKGINGPMYPALPALICTTELCYKKGQRGLRARALHVYRESVGSTQYRILVFSSN